MISSSTISQDTLLRLIPQSKDAQALLAHLRSLYPDNKHLPATSLLAAYIIHDLYNQVSSDEANINRIVTNLQLAAEDLRMLSERIRNLQH